MKLMFYKNKKLWNCFPHFCCLPLASTQAFPLSPLVSISAWTNRCHSSNVMYYNMTLTVKSHLYLFKMRWIPLGEGADLIFKVHCICFWGCRSQGCNVIFNAHWVISIKLLNNYRYLNQWSQSIFSLSCTLKSKIQSFPIIWLYIIKCHTNVRNLPMYWIFTYLEVGSIWHLEGSEDVV